MSESERVSERLVEEFGYCQIHLTLQLAKCEQKKVEQEKVVIVEKMQT